MVKMLIAYEDANLPGYRSKFHTQTIHHFSVGIIMFFSELQDMSVEHAPVIPYISKVSRFLKCKIENNR